MSDNGDTFTGNAMSESALANKTQHNQKSPLLKLPAELRNQIYCHVFKGHVISMPPSYIGSPRLRVYPEEELEKESLTISSVSHFLALTQTCRQIHQETYTLPFELTELRIEADFTDTFEIPPVQSFLDRLSDERRAAITKMSASNEFYEYYIWAYCTSAEHFPWDTYTEADVLEWVDTNPLRALLDSLKGLKCILVFGETSPDIRPTEAAKADALEEARRQCRQVGEWIKLFAKG